MNGHHAPSVTAAPETGPPTLRIENISKSFNGTLALDGVSLTVRPGEVHGLLGMNGSGKSTLIKVLAGVHAPDPGGRMEFNGAPVSLPLKPSDFRRLGMSFVHQNLGLVPSMTVLENLRLSSIAIARRWRIDWAAEQRATEETLERYGLKIEPWRQVAELSAVNRALLAIVRAFEEIRQECERTDRPGLVLLDEPTPFLPSEGVRQLFDLMRKIAATGSSVIFISHDIDEVMDITDSVTVLRDGKVSGEIATRLADRDRMIEMIIGRNLASQPRHETHVPPEAGKTPYLRVEGLSGEGIQPCDITIGEGEIVGLTGLIGSGFERVPYLLFGAAPASAGRITTAEGESVDLTTMTPARAIARRFALLPGDRNEQGGVGTLSIFENMFLPGMGDYYDAGFLRTSRMRSDARRLGEEFEVRPNDPDKGLADLSGGNAQKVLIARWMNRNPRFLLLDEPTQGVDVGTRANIFAALSDAAEQGMSMICASSDPEQLDEICDRVLVFARGRIVDEITGERLSKDNIVQACYTSIEAAEKMRSSTAA
jgi:ribose transport system ATP-binding protein